MPPRTIWRKFCGLWPGIVRGTRQTSSGPPADHCGNCCRSSPSQTLSSSAPTLYFTFFVRDLATKIVAVRTGFRRIYQGIMPLGCHIMVNGGRDQPVVVNAMLRVQRRGPGDSLWGRSRRTPADRRQAGTGQAKGQPAHGAVVSVSGEIGGVVGVGPVGGVQVPQVARRESALVQAVCVSVWLSSVVASGRRATAATTRTAATLPVRQ